MNNILCQMLVSPIEDIDEFVSRQIKLIYADPPPISPRHVLCFTGVFDRHWASLLKVATDVQYTEIAWTSYPKHDNEEEMVNFFWMTSSRKSLMIVINDYAREHGFAVAEAAEVQLEDTQH